MNLSSILRCQEHLRELRRTQYHHESWHLFRAHVRAAVTDHMREHVPLSLNLDTDLTAVDLALQNLHQRLDHCDQILSEECQRQEPLYNQLSEEIYRADLVRIKKIIADPTKDLDALWDMRTAMTPEELDMIQARLNAFNDWRVPGMIIRPGMDGWIDNLVALDPLYLVDLDQALLRPALQRYPRMYQQRLRQYTIDEHQPEMLSKLPKNQMGLVFCHDFFRVKPVRVIQQYLQDIWHLLRPGGILVFSYSDGDNSKSSELVERRVNCYTPARLIRQAWLQQGFETVFEYESEDGWNWAEIRRPGILTSLRGGQSLARIHPIV